MANTLVNPYADARGTWVRGSFHGHCREHSGCSSVPLAESVRDYERIGAQFLAVTDHDHVTDLAAVRADHPDMILLDGFEYSRGENVLFIGGGAEDVLELPLREAAARADELLTILCHPQPGPGEEYWTIEKIRSLLGRTPDGIEVYNGHYGIDRMVDAGCRPLYTRLWDEFLTAGIRVWGFANDDFHEPADFDNAFNMVLVKEMTERAVIDAAKRGRFYASTGLLLERIGLGDGRIEVVTAAPCVGRFVGPGGAILSEADGTRFEYTVGDEGYIRFEGKGASGLLFLQPMFQSAAAGWPAE